MWYNGQVGGGLPEEPLTPKEERALAECRRWQEKLRQEKLAHEGTWALLAREQRTLRDAAAALDEACEDCPNDKVCVSECGLMIKLREVLRG